MARTITLSVPDSLEALIKAQAQARGSRTIDECALAILAEALATPPVVPADRHALEAELRKGLTGDARAPSADDWNRKKADLVARHPQSKAG